MLTRFELCLTLTIFVNRICLSGFEKVSDKLKVT